MFDLLEGPDSTRPALEFLSDGTRVSYAMLRHRIRELAPSLRGQKGKFLPFTPTRTPASITDLIAHLECGMALGLLDERRTPIERAGVTERLLAYPALDRDRIVLPTSGSTGAPKLVVHTEESLIAAAVASEQNLGWAVNGDRWYLNLPLAHVGGLALLIRCIRARQTIVVGAARSSEPEHVLSELARGQVSLASFVPTQIARLLREEKSAERLSLRAVLVGGAPISETLRRRARELGWPLLTTYGLTEMSSQVATESPSLLYRDEDDSRLPPPGSVGQPLPGVSVRVQGDGTLQVGGPMALRTYLGQGSPLDAEGYFTTSDLGSLSPDGTLTVLGRKDNMLITGGENVSPEIVEAALLEVPGVRDCCVSGAPDPEWGERVVATLVVEEPEPSDSVLRGALEAKLPHFAIPKEFRRVSALPLLPNGKLDRRAVRSALVS